MGTVSEPSAERQSASKQYPRLLVITMSHANIAAAARGSLEMFDDVLRMQNQLISDFTRHDDRQERFKKQFATESRRHHSAISGMSCELNGTSTSTAVLYEASTIESNTSSSLDDPSALPRRRSVLVRQLDKLKNKNAQHLREELSCFYLPPVVTTDIVCDTCSGFKTAALVEPLPDPWQQYLCQDSGKRYFYHSQTRQVLWAPPPETSPFSVLVFERTNAADTVCRCIPSRVRRIQCMDKFRQYARDAAHEETQKRNKELHGAFKTLTHSLLLSTKKTS